MERRAKLIDFGLAKVGLVSANIEGPLLTLGSEPVLGGAIHILDLNSFTLRLHFGTVNFGLTSHREMDFLDDGREVVWPSAEEFKVVGHYLHASWCENAFATSSPLLVRLVAWQDDRNEKDTNLIGSLLSSRVSLSVGVAMCCLLFLNLVLTCVDRRNVQFADDPLWFFFHAQTFFSQNMASNFRGSLGFLAPEAFRRGWRVDLVRELSPPRWESSDEFSNKLVAHGRVVSIQDTLTVIAVG